jgi:hypothetical protein
LGEPMGEPYYCFLVSTNVLNNREKRIFGGFDGKEKFR